MVGSGFIPWGLPCHFPALSPRYIQLMRCMPYFWKQLMVWFCFVCLVLTVIFVCGVICFGVCFCFPKLMCIVITPPLPPTFFLFLYPITAGSSWSKTSARKSSTMGYSNRRWWGPGRQWGLWRQFWGGRGRGGRWWLNNTIDWLQYLHTLQTLGLTVELYNNRETQYRSFEKAEFNFSLPIKSALCNFSVEVKQICCHWYTLEYAYGSL